ncbi:ATP-binding protein [uncultured Pseudokineococcus sp.]|uniref:ATP-binding protein n=1 Tax=uncultured Pseudokineococcus sp. TaxID=1642928 RepID=UPI0026243880|nr:ATP-binding protein [uncultured Pseudokineococcus sp.]
MAHAAPVREVVVRCPPVDVRGARRVVVGCCGGAGWHEDVADVAELLVSELVTNALVHGGGAASMAVVVAPGGVRVEVADDLPDELEPVVRPASASATGGRGLALVEALATAWGVRRAPGGKVVWFHLDARPGEGPAQG